MKLTKAQKTSRDEIVSKLREQEERLDEVISEFNAAVEAKWDEIVAPALAKHKEALDEAREFCEQIAGDIQNFYDDKSEKWQEGDRGQAVEDMRSEWESVDLDEPTIEPPSEVEKPWITHSASIEELPEEPSA